MRTGRLSGTERGFGAVWVLAAIALGPLRHACGVQPEESSPQVGSDAASGGDPAEDTAGAVLGGAARARFGTQGTSWATIGVGGGGAIDGEGEGGTDLTGFVQLTWFIVDDLEFGGEVGAWHFQQEGEDAVGGSLSALLRWHFVNEERLSLFVDGGIGLLGASEEVPEGGTKQNFLPRAGVGATYRPWDGDTRLMLGLRWHHISNARLSGSEDNPSRDGVMLYAGLCVPF